MEKSREIHSKVDTLKKGDTIKISYGSSLSKTNEVELKVRSRNKVRKGTIDKITFENVNNPKGVKFYAYNRGNGWGFAVGDMGISNVNIIDSYAKGGSTYQGGGEIFDISIFNDGVRSKYGEEENLTLEELIESLMYYDVISEKYNEEELLSEIKKIKEFPHNRKDFGDSFMRVSVYKRTQKSKGGSTYAKGGVIVDLFEEYEQQPAQVRVIYDKYEDKIIDGDYDYSDSAEFLKEMQKIGYTFEYGLDNEPYGLRPIGVSLNQLEGYEEYAKGGSTYAKGGEVSQEDRKKLELERLKLINQAFKIFPNSKKQLEVRKKIKEIDKKLAKYSKGGEISSISDLYDSEEASNYPYARDMVAYFIFGDREDNIIANAIKGTYSKERADESALSEIMLDYENNWQDNLEEIDVETVNELGDLTDYYAKGGEIKSIGIPFDASRAKKAAVIGSPKLGGVDDYIGEVSISENINGVKDVLALSKAKYPKHDIWYIEVGEEEGEPIWEISEEGKELWVVSYEGVEFAKGGALRNIMKSIKDYAAPFAVIAVDTKKGKVLKQDISIQDYNLIPAHYREMAREFPNAEIRVEDSTGVSMYAKGGSVKSKGYFTGELSFLNW